MKNCMNMSILFWGRPIQYATEEMTHSVGKDPTHLRANFLESPEAKETVGSININQVTMSETRYHSDV